jgi:hypothetical protein
MSKERSKKQDQNQQTQQSPGKAKGEQSQDKKDISLPRIDRPEGPFEHSGEVAGWTKEEREEKQDLEGKRQPKGPGKQDQEE